MMIENHDELMPFTRFIARMDMEWIAGEVQG